MTDTNYIPADMTQKGLKQIAFIGIQTQTSDLNQIACLEM